MLRIFSLNTTTDSPPEDPLVCIKPQYWIVMKILMIMIHQPPWNPTKVGTDIEDLFLGNNPNRLLPEYRAEWEEEGKSLWLSLCSMFLFCSGTTPFSTIVHVFSTVESGCDQHQFPCLFMLLDYISKSKYHHPHSSVQLLLLREIFFSWKMRAFNFDF